MIRRGKEWTCPVWGIGADLSSLASSDGSACGICEMTAICPSNRGDGDFLSTIPAHIVAMVGYPSGQRGQTVNLLAYAFIGSNPIPTTTFNPPPAPSCLCLRLWTFPKRCLQSNHTVNPGFGRAMRLVSNAKLSLLRCATFAV